MSKINVIYFQEFLKKRDKTLIWKPYGFNFCLENIVKCRHFQAKTQSILLRIVYAIESNKPILKKPYCSNLEHKMKKFYCAIYCIFDASRPKKYIITYRTHKADYRSEIMKQSQLF